MSQYIPFNTNQPSYPVTLIDSHAPTGSVLDCAHARIKAGTDLLESLTCVTIKGIDDGDLYRLTHAAYLLLRDGVDLLDVARRGVD